jgi:hypothetical protein
MLDNELFEYLQAAARAGRLEFRIAVTQLDAGEVRFILHPLGRDGITMDVILQTDGGLTAEAVEVEWNRDWDQYPRNAA